MLLIADDVPVVKFEVFSFKGDYKQGEIDVFLDDVTTTIREFKERLGTLQESLGPLLREIEILLIAEGVRSVRFSVTQRSGYRIDQAGAFIVQMLITMEALEAQVHISSFVGQPGTGASVIYGGTCGSGAYGMSPTQAGYVPGGTNGISDAQHAEAIAQRDQYITRLQQESAYLRAELESAQYRLGTAGHQSPLALKSPRLRNRQGIVAGGRGP